VAWPLGSPAHAVPHEPQFLVSVWVSTHDPLQLTWPLLQLEVQTPLEHTSVAPQTLPQLPQLLGSVLVSEQALPHLA